MLNLVEEAKQLLCDHKFNSREQRDSAKEALLCDVDHQSIEFIDNYAPDCYGIEIAARCFWEAFVVRQDIFRKAGAVSSLPWPSHGRKHKTTGWPPGFKGLSRPTSFKGTDTTLT